jgi:hypothetical protein
LAPSSIERGSVSPESTAVSSASVAWATICPASLRH